MIHLVGSFAFKTLAADHFCIYPVLLTQSGKFQFLRCDETKHSFMPFLCYCNMGQYSFKITISQKISEIRTYFMSNVYLIYSLPRCFSQAFRHLNVAK